MGSLLKPHTNDSQRFHSGIDKNHTCFTRNYWPKRYQSTMDASPGNHSAGARNRHCNVSMRNFYPFPSWRECGVISTTTAFSPIPMPPPRPFLCPHIPSSCCLGGDFSSSPVCHPPCPIQTRLFFQYFLTRE